MDYLPITVQMKDRRCLLVGGGDVAARKLKHLLKAQSQVTVVSHTFNEEIRQLAKECVIELIQGEFEAEQLKDCYLVVAATNDASVNQRVSLAAQELNVWVNVVDDLALSTFIMPAVIDRSPLLIAVSSSGVSPVLARKIREKIEWLLPRSLGLLLNRLKQLRPLAKKKFRHVNDKRRFSEWYIESVLDDETQLQQEPPKLFEQFEQAEDSLGKVYLVGAGPGDAELLTVKALKILQKADIVLHDALVSDEILDCVRRDATLVHVGKRANRHFVAQEKTNELLVQYARQGLKVVRLKGGDPFIFGRGGEELQVLAEHGIACEVVPGITAASGCASYAGIPLTHRDYSQSVRLVTGHEKGSKNSFDWRNLAYPNQTLVFYMGLMRNQAIADSLIFYGRSSKTPVAIVENGTTAKQRVIVGELAQLPAMVDNYQVQSPAVIIVGEVVQLASQLHWFEQGQLILAEAASGEAVEGLSYRKVVNQ